VASRKNLSVGSTFQRSSSSSSAADTARGCRAPSASSNESGLLLPKKKNVLRSNVSQHFFYANHSAFEAETEQPHFSLPTSGAPFLFFAPPSAARGYCSR